MEDETGSGHLDFQKLGEKAASEHMWFSQKPAATPEMHVQQLMIDLHDAHEENKQLREDLARALEKARMKFSHLCLVAIVTAFATHTAWVALGVLSK